MVVADQYQRPRMNAKALASASASGQQPSSGPQVPQSRAKKWYDRQHPAHACPGTAPGIPHPGWESLTLPSHRAELIRGKHGVEIVSEHDKDNGHIHFPVVPSEPRSVTILVQNHGAEAVTLRRCQPHQQSREFSFTDEQGATQGQSLMLHPGRAPSPAPRPDLPEEMQDPALASLPRRQHVPHPGAVPDHLQWLLLHRGGLRVH